MHKWMRGRKWLHRAVGGAVAGPFSIVLHELGHFAAFILFEFRDPVLRFSSASWAGSGRFKALWRAGDVEAAAAIAEPWQVAVGSAAGPIVSYVTAIACVLAVRRSGPGPLSLVLGLGLSAPLQGVAALMILPWKLSGRPFTGNQDEVWVAWVTGIPETLALLPGLFCLLLAYWFLTTAIPRGQRLRVLVPTLVGMIMGGFVWILWLGPLLLP